MDFSTVSVTSSGAAGSAAAAKPNGALPVPDRAAPDSTTDPKFGDILNQIQTQYGAKPEKPREIKKTLGKDDFMRIMIMQMRNQDPTQPFKAEQMAAELAQYASVEQLQNLNQTVGKLIQNQNPMERLAMTNLIGKTVTVDRERFPHADGETHSLNFALPSEAKSVKAQVWNEANEMVFEKDLGALKQGDSSAIWDGKLSNGLAARAGGYRLKIDARDERDMPIQINTKMNSRIIGVSFEGQEAVFLVGNPASPDKITMKNITRIDDSGPGLQTNLIPGARSLADASGAPVVPADAKAAASGISDAQPQAAVPPGSTSNYFTFQKGVGSQSLDQRKLTPEVRQQLALYEQQKLETESAKSAPSGVQEAGFPNGLSE
jgi:flagellar basal-body rod modification protein FlgD